MTKQITCDEVEFVGGPLDGHRQQMTVPGEVFLGVTMEPSRPGVVRRLFDRIRMKGQLLRLAVYELHEDNGQYFYVYVVTQMFAHSSRSTWAARDTRTSSKRQER